MRQFGIVRWFDKLSGSGSIDGNDGNSYWVFACNILGAKTMYEHTACMYLERDQTVEFEIVPGCESCGACNVSNGIFDAEHWERIKDKSLAFRLDEHGNAINGLFELRQK